MPRASVLAGRRIEQYSSPNAGGQMSAIYGAVLHIAQGTYRGTISWQMNPNQRYASGQSVTTCSTWIVGRSTGEWAQMTPSDRIAWCQRSGSRTWVSIELAGYAPDKPTAWQIEACAQLLVWLHRTHRVPIAVADHPGERGLGHHSMDREWKGEEWGHEACPGSGVIGAKAAIVARARAILAGEDDTVTPEDIKAIAAASAQATLDAWLGRDTNRKQVKDLIAAAGGLAPQIDTTTGRTDATTARTEEAVKRIELAISNLPREVVERLGDGDVDDIIAALIAAGVDPAELRDAAARAVPA